MSGLGVYLAGQEERGDGLLYWKTIRRFQQTSQETPDRIAWQSPATHAQEEQTKLHSLEFDQRGYGWQ